MSPGFHVVIPSRYQSSRLPGKALLDIGGKTLIQHVYESASGSQASGVTIATDDERIEDVARSFGAEVIMTSADHVSGTDRVTEVIKRKNFEDETIIVNVQGDEYALPPVIIDQVAMALGDDPEKQMATLCEKIESLDDVTDPAVVKVVRDKNDKGIYFSRSPIPWHSNFSESDFSACKVYRHIGLYAYRAGFLKRFSDLYTCELEETEQLEQLRAIYHGFSIHVVEACAQSGHGIDTEKDLEMARRHFLQDSD